jgi:CMP-N-acetylneuraminic acid synthetase
MKKERTALIPVKGSSERIKNKNTRPFCGTSLYELKLEQLKKVRGFSNIIVSSENEKILNIAREKGFNVHVRDPKYSTSYVPMSSVYSYIASEIKGEHIAWINVTNPLADAENYEKAIKEYNKMNSAYDCLLSVYEVKDNIFYNGKPVNFKPYPWPRSQDLKGLCAMSFVINILKREDMVRWGSCVGKNPYFFYLDKVISTDVDFKEDFDFCEVVYKQRYEDIKPKGGLK